MLLLCNYNTAVFNVAPDGNDDNKGSKSGPFQSLERAKHAASELIAEGAIDEEFRVWLRCGTYFFDQSVFFNADVFKCTFRSAVN